MNRHVRRVVRAGLVLGAVIAGVVAYRRLRTRPTQREPEPITERHSGAFLVRRRCEPDRLEDVRDAVERHGGTSADEWLLALEGASTASLFLDRTGDDPELVWYVEVPWAAVEQWDGDDPETTVAAAFPLTHEALDDADEPVDRELLVHAVHPSRPRRTVVDAVALEGTGDALEREAQADRTADRSVDVELVRMDLESGVPERFADWFAALSRNVTDGELRLNRIEAWSIEMLEAEDMFTESIFLERRPDGYSLLGYMETAEMARVYDAYYDTWNPVARASELVLGRVLVDPAVILEYPLETDVELLAHATNPDRPRRASACERFSSESSAE
ncbi:DUF6176 family protein [Natrarchaeobius chitinivorans]|uniref:Uncharacterized protein n=1 Tax=Natrarchaeobius chitinivorans TaxID=1679083 RepID=A0A3N6LZF6_NATCH|nr:DUF6176 family protein [Natrarchaeobius chitinivorans]RQG94577.1 hypothetical protein EA473_10840 [Natrarchaeobius chitinivorans]